MLISISETAKLNNLRLYYYFKYILTELPKLCDENGVIDPKSLDYLMPWSEDLPEECKKYTAEYDRRCVFLSRRMI